MSPLSVATDQRGASPPLAPADFDYLRNLVKGKAAIVLENGKEYLVESRLSPLVRTEGLGSLAQLVTALRTGRNAALEGKVIDAMTTNETSFFRDIHPFDSMRTTIIPELMEKRRSSRELAFWCAAASSGQEPYSVTMMLREHFPELNGWRFKFLATDISPSMIEKARSGRYSQLEVNRGLPAAYLVKYFDRHGADWAIKPELRNMVEYKLLNLAEPWPSIPQVDIVFIRNVLIYFDRDMKRKILQGIKRTLRPGGFLILGSSETTFNIDDSWTSRTVGKTIVYQAG